MANPLVKSIECVWDAKALLGEGPLYDPRSGILFWLDIKGQILFLYNPDTKRKEQYSLDGNISALGLHAKGGLIAAYKHGFSHIVFDKNMNPTLTPLGDPESHIPHTRFNDGKVDPFGYFWAGTMDNNEVDSEAGNWWRLSPEGITTKMFSGFHVTNGPVFDADRQRAYLTDSARQIIYVANYKSPSDFDELSIFKKFNEDDGYPDGMTLDNKGCLWVAFWDGSCLRRISPNGDISDTIAMPVPRPTSLTFVDHDLYVTSASIGLDVSQNCQSGGLFKIELSHSVARNESFTFG